MDRPTKEQITEAQDVLAQHAQCCVPPFLRDAIRVVLAAAAEPIEEELREEAVAAVLADCGLEGEEAAEVRAHILDSLPYASDNVDHAAEARAYIRGARREGAR